MEGFMIRTGFYDKCVQPSAPLSRAMTQIQIAVQ